MDTFCRHDAIYRKPYRLHQKLLETINTYSQVAGYKISIEKYIAFLYTKNEISENETKNIISMAIATKRTKCLGIDLTKDVRVLYTENYKTLLKEIEEDTKKWKNIPLSWIGRHNIVKMAILPNAIYRLNATPTKIPVAFLEEIEQNNHEIWMESQQTPKSHNTPK